MKAAMLRFGVNYIWGLLNFTVGVAAGGIFVAAALFPYLVHH
jgi:hypothetical protein